MRGHREIDILEFKSSLKPGAFIYGTGSAGQEVFSMLLGQGVNVWGFLDNNTQKKEFCGLKVVSSIQTSSEIDRSIPVIVAIFNPHVDVHKTMMRLRGEGWIHVICFFDLLNWLPDYFPKRWWAEPRYPYETKGQEITRLRTLLADEPSKLLLDAVLKFRMSGDIALAPLPDGQTQYFPEDLPAWRTPIRFVDCGAFDGDTVRSIATKNIPLEAIALFEPDLENFVKIRKTLAPLVPLAIGEAYCWPCGVFSKTTQLTFSSGAGTGSGISTEGSCVIQCVSLDEALAGFSPTVLKMDIEGAEMEALAGAFNTIKENRPGLAICVYHTPDHLWEIPFLLESWNLGYRFFLRAHAFSTFDLVLYAIPI